MSIYQGIASKTAKLVSAGLIAGYLGCGKAPNQPVGYNSGSSYSTLD